MRTVQFEVIGVLFGAHSHRMVSILHAHAMAKCMHLIRSLNGFPFANALQIIVPNHFTFNWIFLLIYSIKEIISTYANRMKFIYTIN